ncbi:hypothetical protein C2G38_2157418 [Gigaspora rosea]|uniref:C2H2-type domain-containing protein n=1 Tax=Gigaspora rosea TaxID=44941 RepID=A0A397W3L6_9GLOM|nr:hypothetical protein C2G38_2157418 [Gigaspora rosea]
MRWLCEYCNRQFTKSNALAQHISKSHPYFQNMTNQLVPDEQSDDNIWELPDYSLHYDSSSEYDSNNSSIIDVTEVIPASPMPGFDPLWETESDFNEVPMTYDVNMEADYPSTDSELLSVEDEQPRTESIEIDPDDYDGASFDDAFHDLQHPQDVEWPNDAYQEFMEIVNRYQFSNSVGDVVIKFFNKYSNFDISPLPSTTKSGKEFLDNSTIPHMMFKEISITTYQGITYTFYYQSLIKAIKSLLMIDKQEESSLSIGQRLLLIILCLMILLTPIANKPKLHFVVRNNIITFIPRISTIIADMLEADKFTNVYQPSFTQRPCGSCLILKDDLNNISLTSVSSRTPNNMKRAIENEEAQDYSIHPKPNAFWGIR